MTQPTWLLLDILLAIHDEQLAEHGGAEGLRDHRLLESALAPPLNRAAYDNCDLAAQAASLAHGIVRNHPFVDGNKRTAYTAAETFLLLNGLEVTAPDAECVVATEQLASGEMPEDEFADWLRHNARPA